MSPREIPVCVVLPVFNGEAFLRDAIDSVLNQSFSEFELIICDDGSTDGSYSIVSEFRDERLTFLQNEKNQGLFPTLNRSIKNSSGQLIKLWSQDDIMKSTCLEQFVDFMNNHPTVGMAYSAYDEIGPSGELLRPAPVDLTPEVISPSLAVQIMFYHGSITGNIANVMLRKSALATLGLFREDLVVSGDFEMWVRLSEKYPLGFIRKPLIDLRIHPGQFSRRKGIYSQFMKEDFEIVQTLKRRLPTSLLEHARRYDRRHRQLQYFHHLVRALLTRDWSEARKTYRQLERFGPLPGLLLIWLFTLDQRLFRLKPHYVDG